MPWPTPTQYYEAIQNPRSCVGDEELMEGQVACNVQGMPMLWSGHFADVYKIECPATGSTWALKCFTREIAGLRDRYRDISAHLEQAKLPFTVGFQYLESGIRVGGRWHPALKMRWIEGLSLHQFVENHVNRPKMLGQLLAIWPKLARRLREARVAHADLQHGNVLLVPMHRGQLALKLIDYDGMFIPSLADRPSGELGHPAYQHPQRLREGTYSIEVDRFSHLAVYCAVRCLKVGRHGLWIRFNNDDNLLFRETDFRNPRNSELFRVLWGLPDRDARALVGRLALACESPLDQVPLLSEVLVKGDGKVIPLTQRQETEVQAMLSPPSRVSLALPDASLKETGEAGGRDSPNFRGHRPGTAAQQWSAMVDENGTVPFPATPPPPVVKNEQQIVDWVAAGGNPFAEAEPPILAELVEEPEAEESIEAAMPSFGHIFIYVILSMLFSVTIAPVLMACRLLLAIVKGMNRIVEETMLATDRLLLSLVGEENTILHNFLRLLAFLALAAGIVIVYEMLAQPW